MDCYIFCFSYICEDLKSLHVNLYICSRIYIVYCTFPITLKDNSLYVNENAVRGVLKHLRDIYIYYLYIICTLIL